MESQGVTHVGGRRIGHGGLVATAGSAAAAPFDATVVVHGSAQGLTIQHGSVHAGLVRFLIDSTNDTTNNLGSDIAMFTPASGKTVDNVLADLGDEFSDDGHTAAKGTQELVQDARIVGLAGVVKGTPVTVTEQLSAGTYYLFDANSVAPGAPPKLTTLQVSGPGGDQTDPIFPFPNIGALPIRLPFSVRGLFPAYSPAPARSRYTSPTRCTARSRSPSRCTARSGATAASSRATSPSS